MRTLVSVATKYPAAYFATCVTIGMIIRYWMAAGSFSKFINPLFPLIVR